MPSAQTAASTDVVSRAIALIGSGFLPRVLTDLGMAGRWICFVRAIRSSIFRLGATNAPHLAGRPLTSVLLFYRAVVVLFGPAPLACLHVSGPGPDNNYVVALGADERLREFIS
jgi:hypothetical protein